MLRLFPRPGLAILLAAGAVAATPSSAGFSKGPYLQAPGATTMSLLWESPKALAATVRYGRGKRLDQVQDVPAPRAMRVVSKVAASSLEGSSESREITNTVYLYEVSLRDLLPGTRYSYQVELGRESSGTHHFRTFAEDPRQVRFIVYGDTRTRPKVHASVVRGFSEHHPDFILHTGDLVARGQDYDLWGREFFGPLADVIDHIPLLPTIGNHEQDGVLYLSYFDLPPPERWYSFDLGPVHVLALDFHYPEATHQQFAFAQADLRRSQAPWKVVFLHYPMFNIGGHASNWGNDTYLPLFHETDVDVVVGGHSHLYERFRPIVPSQGGADHPILFLTAGGGGAPLYPVYDHPALASKASTNNFILMDVTPQRLKGTAYLASGKVLDRFELRKRNGELISQLRDQAYPEEWLRTHFEGAEMLQGEARTLPTPTQPADVLLTVRPLTNAPATMEWEIDLTPESKAYYTWPEAPLRVRTPAIGEAERVFRIPVRATGAKPVTAKPGAELSPDLMFQANASSGDEHFVIRGHASYRSGEGREE